MANPRIAGASTLAALIFVACTSFATVRSAEVWPGPTFTAQVSTTSSPGPVAGWLWSFDCAGDCDHSISALDMTFAYGKRAENETSFARRQPRIILRVGPGHWAGDGE